jgi:ribosomal protein RSM22 (predicted rRNA methylase)
MTSDHHRLAYLAARMPATFAVVKRVLEECKKRVPSFSPKTLCDIGSGPGTAAWASINIFPEITKIFLYEKDPQWQHIGKLLMDHSQHPALNHAVWNQTDLMHENTFISNDLSILSYVIGELPMDAMTQLILQAWNSTSHMLVIIEPGTPHGFDRIKLVRDQLIKLGAFLVAPCPHHNICPMEHGDWCHFAERLERTPLHMAVKDATLGYEDEKFSFVAASKAPIELPYARILRHPQHHSGHIDFFLCGKEGLEKRTLSRRHKDLYKKAKKLEWGNAFETD